GADDEGQEDGDEDRLGVLANDGLAPPGGGHRRRRRHLIRLADLAFADVHQLFSTVRNASCGTSTRPTCFMRFLPSFCFSSSLRLGVMSPPYHFPLPFFPTAFTFS